MKSLHSHADDQPAVNSVSIKGATSTNVNAPGSSQKKRQDNPRQSNNAPSNVKKQASNLTYVPIVEQVTPQKQDDENVGNNAPVQ